MEQQSQVIQAAKENVNLIDANNIKVATALGLIHIILVMVILVMVIFFAFSGGILLIMSAIYIWVIFPRTGKMSKICLNFFF